MATAASRPTTTTTTARTASQKIVLVLGVVFTLVGLAGFAVTGFDGFAAHDTGETLLGFELNPLHNIVHLVLGLGALLAWRRHDTARTYGWLLFAGYGAVFVYGLLAGGSDADILSINAADNGLHLATALAGLVAGVLPARDGRYSSSR
jgi:hypothetical protein